MSAKRLTEENPIWLEEELWYTAEYPDAEEIDDVYMKLREYENTGLEPEEVSRLKADVEEIKKSVDSLWEKQEFIKFLEAKGIDVSAGVDWMCEVFDLLHDEKNGKILSIDRLREIVEADRDGRLEIFSPEGPPTVFYIPDYEDGLCLKDVSGLISKEEFEKVLKEVKEEVEGEYKEEKEKRPCLTWSFGLGVWY